MYYDFVQFQFLLGRLKTEILISFIFAPPLFQFLLGRLKTGFLGPAAYGEYFVSIPAR